MELAINYWAVVVCAVISMPLGFLWYGALFGKTWAKVIKADVHTEEERRNMQKAAGPLYVVQFLLMLFQAYVLARFIAVWPDASGYETALWLWAGFMVPVVAGASMWNNDSRQVAWTRFLLQGGFQLLCMVLFGLILGIWR